MKNYVHPQLQKKYPTFKPKEEKQQEEESK